MENKQFAGRTLGVFAIAIFLLLPPSLAADTSEDLAAARSAFEANLQAIRDHDRAAYLDGYLPSEHLAIVGPAGIALGFEAWSAEAGDNWPEVFEARDLRLVPIRPGVVYGTYRYRVRIDGSELTGISERLFVATSAGWKISVSTAFPAQPGTPPPPRALIGATLIDGTGRDPIVDAIVVIRDGRVDCAGSRGECPLPTGIETLDLSGKWITPGLVDSHVHFSQTGWADGRPDFIDVRERYPYEETQARLRSDPQSFFRAYLCSGVTAVFDNGGYPWTWQLRARAAGDTWAPHVAAAGPLLSTLDFWLNLPAEKQFMYLADEEAAGEQVRYLAAHDSDAVKVWFIPVREREFAQMESAVLAAGRAARERNLPLIVHATGLREAKVALRAGAKLLVHSVWDQAVDDEFLQLARETGTTYCPTLTVARGYAQLARAVATGNSLEIDDPNGCLDMETRDLLAASGSLGNELVSAEGLTEREQRVAERERIGSENLARIAAGGIPVAMGTDAGNPLTLPGPSVYAEMEAMQSAGLTPMQVLIAATRQGAVVMGRGTDLGTIEAGKVADLLVLDADPVMDIANMRRLRWVMRGGELRPHEELRAR